MTFQTTKHTISLTRFIPAATSEIYAAWTDPQRMTLWLGNVTADVRVGGRYRFESPAENSGTYIYTGEYLVLEADRRVVQSFLAGEPDPNVPNPYMNEYLEIQLREIAPEQTELTFINGWEGEALNEEATIAVRAAWSEWIDRMQKSLP